MDADTKNISYIAIVGLIAIVAVVALLGGNSGPTTVIPAEAQVARQGNTNTGNSVGQQGAAPFDYGGFDYEDSQRTGRQGDVLVGSGGSAQASLPESSDYDFSVDGFGGTGGTQQLDYNLPNRDNMQQCQEFLISRVSDQNRDRSALKYNEKLDVLTVERLLEGKSVMKTFQGFNTVCEGGNYEAILFAAMGTPLSTGSTSTASTYNQDPWATPQTDTSTQDKPVWKIAQEDIARTLEFVTSESESDFETAVQQIPECSTYESIVKLYTLEEQYRPPLPNREARLDYLLSSQKASECDIIFDALVLLNKFGVIEPVQPADLVELETRSIEDLTPDRLPSQSYEETRSEPVADVGVTGSSSWWSFP